MTFPSQTRTERQGRFTPSSAMGDVEQGMREAVNPTGVSTKYLKRNFKAYKVLRNRKIHKDLKKLKGKSDKSIERMATMAVLQKHGVKRRKLRRGFNYGKYTKKQIRKAKARVLAKPKTKVPQGKVARHVRNVMQNRRIMKTKLWKGQGYDIRKGYR